MKRLARKCRRYFLLVLFVCSYTTRESDMTTVSPNQHLIKYANDVNLIVSEISDSNIDTDFNHNKQRAIKSKMVINLQKNQGHDFPPPQPTEHSLPCSFQWYRSGSSGQVPRCFFCSATSAVRNISNTF